MKIISLFILLAISGLVSCHSTCPAPGPEATPSSSEDTFVFAVTLGPETNSGFIDENMPTSSYSNYPEMFVGTWTHGGGFVKHRYIFAPDLSSIPQTARIDSAFITFQGTDNATSENVIGGQFNNYSDNSFYMERISSSWNTSTVNWNNQPATTTMNRIEVADLGDGNEGSGKISILPLVKDMVALQSSSYGIMLKLQDETTDSYKRILFASNNHSDASLHPTLKIYYKK